MNSKVPGNAGNSRFRTILFDFDGTVYDTVEGITKSVQYALDRHGIKAETEELRCFAGPPLVEKLMEVYGVSEKEAVQLVSDFRERYLPVGVYESAPFPGMRELLLSLKKAGYRLGIATNKPQELAELLLKRSELLEYFDVVVGSNSKIHNEQKWQMIMRAMEYLSADPVSTVLIGDTKYDAEGAGKCSIPCIGVSWGCAGPGELEASGVAAIVDSPEELLAFFQ